VIDETVSPPAPGLRRFLKSDDRAGFFRMRGGGIGWGLRRRDRRQNALPDRPVVALARDGSAMYTIQGLWTAARENLAHGIRPSSTIIRIGFSRRPMR